MPLIRDFTPEDYQALVELWKELDLGRPERGDDLSVINETLRLGGKLFLMEQQGELIGTAWVTNNGRRLYLHHMGIKQAFREKGFGAVLMDEIIGYARAMKMQIKLEVHTENDKARRLYEKYGFEELEGYRVLINRKPSG